MYSTKSNNIKKNYHKNVVGIEFSTTLRKVPNGNAIPSQGGGQSGIHRRIATQRSNIYLKNLIKKFVQN